jgi:hypothetical protein
MKYANLDEAVKWIKLVKRLNTDIAIAVTGREQSGKSTLALKIARILNNNKFIDLKTQVGYDIEESLKELRNLKENSIYVLDEAIRVAYNRQFMSSGNRKVNVLFRQIGSKKSTVFVVMPNFWEMDSSLRDRRVALWIHCLGPSQINKETNIPERFEAVMFEPNEHAFDRDKWGLDFEFTRIKKARKKGSQFHISVSTTINQQIKMYARMSNYVKHFSYAPLPSDYFLRYKKMSDERKFEDDTDTDKASSLLTKNKACLNTLMRHMSKELGYSQQKISDAMDGALDRSQISRRLNYNKVGKI